MRLSKLSYFADFYISMVLIAGLASFGSMLPTWLKRGEWVLYASLGFVLWTLLEYAIHRWLYHHVPYFKDIHEAHHAEPNAYIGAPATVGIALIFAIFFAPLATFNVVAASGLTAGVLMGYLAYMILHHAAHYWTLPPGSWLYQARRHHALHHYSSQASNFGIITSFWDHVFGTATRRGRVHAAVTSD